ncbi:MAG: hypothetical protein Q7R54_01940 [bacterium]|nr:hypothetical protein [bacterium]
MTIQPTDEVNPDDLIRVEFPEQIKDLVRKTPTYDSMMLYDQFRGRLIGGHIENDLAVFEQYPTVYLKPAEKRTSRGNLLRAKGTTIALRSGTINHMRALELLDMPLPGPMFTSGVLVWQGGFQEPTTPEPFVAVKGQRGTGYARMYAAHQEDLHKAAMEKVQLRDALRTFFSEFLDHYSDIDSRIRRLCGVALVPAVTKSNGPAHLHYIPAQFMKGKYEVFC